MDFARKLILIIFFASIFITAQIVHDSEMQKRSQVYPWPEAYMVKAFNLGLNSVSASFFWLKTRVELPFLPNGSDYFLEGLNLVNDLNPKWSTPYAFSVLVLPSINSFQDRLAVALQIGNRGLEQAEPNWKIPFYMGVIYQLELKDRVNAAKHFDLAAATKDVPEFIRRFAINYGINPNSIQATRDAWIVLYETAEDESFKLRAEQRIIHLDILISLNAASKKFYEKNGVYARSVDELLQSRLISAIPESPLGFKFKVYEEGVIGISPE